MRLTRFPGEEALNEAAARLLAQCLQIQAAEPVGVMLSGGRTPLPVYRAVASLGVQASPGVHILFSDERMVPPLSPDSNYGNALPMLRAAGVPPERIMRVHTDLPLDAAASEYGRALQTFLDGGGRLVLGLLGLGADGHTASLFTLEDAARHGTELALPVPRPAGPGRVTVTPGLLRCIDRIVFLVVGRDKARITARLLESPEETPAGLAVAGAPRVDLWSA